MAPTFNRSTFGGATANSYDSTTTQLATSAVRYVEPLAESIDIRVNPLTRLFGFGKEVDNVKIEWTDERLAALSDTLGGSYSTTNTTITVANGNKFQAYQVVKVDSELFLVTSILSNTLTVSFAQAGTTNANHANGATILIVGVALPENISSPAASMALGQAYLNYTQLFDAAIQISNRQNYANNYFTRTPEYEWRLRQKITELSRLLERTLFHGLPQAPSSTIPSMMGGFAGFITANATALASAAFTERQFLDALAPAYDDIGGEYLGDTVICGRFAKQVIGSWADPARRLTGGDTSYTAKVDKIITDFGDLDVMMHYHCPANELYFINPQNYSIRPYKGYGRWHDGPLPADGEFMKGHVAGDYGLVALGDRASAKLTGFSTSATDYATLSV